MTKDIMELLKSANRGELTVLEFIDRLHMHAYEHKIAARDIEALKELDGANGLEFWIQEVANLILEREQTRSDE